MTRQPCPNCGGTEWHSTRFGATGNRGPGEPLPTGTDAVVCVACGRTYLDRNGGLHLVTSRLSCEGRLEEPHQGEMACSLGGGCAVAKEMREYAASGDEQARQLVRNTHQDRGLPAWLTEG